jgi:hypothetical protein
VAAGLLLLVCQFVNMLAAAEMHECQTTDRPGFCRFASRPPCGYSLSKYRSDGYMLLVRY